MVIETVGQTAAVGTAAPQGTSVCVRTNTFATLTRYVRHMHGNVVVLESSRSSTMALPAVKVTRPLHLVAVLVMVVRVLVTHWHWQAVCSHHTSLSVVALAFEFAFYCSGTLWQAIDITARKQHHSSIQLRLHRTAPFHSDS